MSAERFLKQFNTPYDLVYLDPPFAYGKKVNLVEEVFRRGIVKSGGMAIIHCPEEDEWPEKGDTWEVADKRKYGRSILLFFRSPDGPGKLLIDRIDPAG